MSDQAKPDVPWNQPGQNDQATADSGAEEVEDSVNDLIEVSCPKCSQALALGREFLGGHCLCSTCDGLMRVTAEEVPGGENRIVVEIVEKETGKKMGDTAPTYAPNIGGAVVGEHTKPVKPWPKQFKGLAGRRAEGERKEQAVNDGSDPAANLLQVPCPACGQVLALGREILGSHCLCSVCEELMLISLKNVDGEGMKVVAEKVDKQTGEKVSDVPSTSSPERGNASMDEDWGNTRPVKPWTGSADTDEADEMDDMGLTMPVPKMDTGGDADEDDMGLTMPVPKMDNEGNATTPGQPPAPSETPTSQTPSEPQKPTGDGEQPWDKTSTGTQGTKGIKLAPPGGAATGRIKGKGPSPTSGVVPTMTTPPTKPPPPTTGSVPTLDTGQVAVLAAKAAKAAISEDAMAWKPPGAAAMPSGNKTQPQATQSEAKKKDAPKKKKSSPFGEAPKASAPKKKAAKRRRVKGCKGLMLTLLMIPVVLGALALFIVAPGIIPGGPEGRVIVDGKIDEGIERIEEFLAARAMNAKADSSGEDGGVDEGLAPVADPGEPSVAIIEPLAIPTYERDAELQKVLSQEGEQVIRRFYGASTVEEKMAFVVGRGEARSDMESYYAGQELLPTVRSVMFRGGTRDVETGFYYGVFDVLESGNDIPRRWCVVDPDTGLYQVDWILYRQIVASELGVMLTTPQGEGVTKRFTMLMKLEERVDDKDSPWTGGAVKVSLQVPMISSNWYPIVMEKSLAESLEVTTKLADGQFAIGVIEIGWITGDKDSSKSQPAIIGIERWGAWARMAF